MCSLSKVSDISRFISGDVIKVIAGTEKDTFTVHVEAIKASGSPSLRALVSQGWKESKENAIDWSHTDTETIKRFVAFLYTGDYDAPCPEPLSSPTKRDGSVDHTKFRHEITKFDFGNMNQSVTFTFGSDLASAPPPGRLVEMLEEPVLHHEEQSVKDLAADSEGEASIQKALVESFETRPLTPISRCLDISLPVEVCKTAAGVFEDSSYPYDKYSYSGLLLAHAQIYSFAKYHFVERLQILALQRLMQVLRHIECSKSHAVLEVTELIRFLYAHTDVTNTDEEPSRKLVSHFAAINYTYLMRGEFEELFSQGGDFTSDLARKIARRLSATVGSTKALEQELDDLENQIHKSKVREGDQDSEIRKLKMELREWQSLSRGSSTKKGRKKSLY